MNPNSKKFKKLKSGTTMWTCPAGELTEKSKPQPLLFLSKPIIKDGLLKAKIKSKSGWIMHLFTPWRLHESLFPTYRQAMRNITARRTGQVR